MDDNLIKLEILNHKLNKLKNKLILERINISLSLTGVVGLNLLTSSLSNQISINSKFISIIATGICLTNIIYTCEKLKDDQFEYDEVSFEKEKLEGKSK